LVFIAPRPDRWFVRAAAVPALVTHSLAAAINQPLRELLPSGPDAGKWRRWQDEMQMLLHEHPVNAAREQRGELPVNSIWLWGGGTRPPARKTSIGTWTNDETAAALARYVGAPASTLPADLDAVIASGGSAETIVVALEQATELAVLERAWIAPAWAAMCRGMVATVTLIADGNGCATVWTARRPGVWQQLTSRIRSPDLRALLADARA
jgi:hypothetical protein